LPERRLLAHGTSAPDTSLVLDVYPFLPGTNFATTSAASYMSLLAGEGA